MGAALAIVSIVGGLASVLIVGPQSVLGGLAVMSIGGSLCTVLVACFVAWRTSARDTVRRETVHVQPPVASSPATSAGP